MYTSRPLDYFTHLMGHEGENSILSYLKKEDLAVRISSYSDFELGVYSSFSLDVQLTEKGIKNIDQVLQAIFKYAQRIAEVGPNKAVADECKIVGDMKFDF